MVTVLINKDVLRVEPSSLHKVLGMKRSLEIPLESIESIEIAKEIARVGPEGTRNPGTSIPHLIHAGSFNSGVKRSFWDVHNPDRAIRINIKNGLLAGIEDRYDEVVVEVADPMETIRKIEGALISNFKIKQL
jgi:hypothetical protein